MIWFTLALFAVSFLVTALLAPKPKTENARASTIDDLQFPQSSEGSPLGLLLGKDRVRAPNTLWYGDFRSEAIKEKVKTGLFSSKRVTVGYKYYIGIDLGLCLGPGVVLKKFWIDKDEVWSGTAGPGETAIVIDKPSLFGGKKKGGGFSGTLRFYGGDNSQPANAYVAGKIGGDGVYPAYVGQAHIVFEGVYIGTTASLRPMSFEVERITNGLGLGGGQHLVGEDLNPMEFLYQLLTLQWGGLGMSTDDIDVPTLQAAATTLHNEGNGMSLNITKANNGEDAVSEVLRQVDGILYQDPVTAKTGTRLIRQDYVVDDLLVLDETNVLAVRNFSRTSWDDTLNQVRVLFADRSNKYETSASLDQDMANINAQGRIRSTNISFPGVKTGGLANKLAAREMSQLSIPLYKVTLEVSRIGGQLRAGDAFVFSWPDYGIEQVIMRVQRFNLGELVDGRIVIDAVQDEFASALTVFAAPEPSAWTPIDRAAAAVVFSRLEEAPYFIVSQVDPTELAQPTTGRGFVYGLARQANSYQQGYSTTVSQDSFATSIVGLDQVPYPNSALLHTAIAATDGFSAGSIASITVKQLQPSTDFLAATDAAGQRAGSNLFVLNGELMSFQTVTDNGNGTWTLGVVKRALLDTSFAAHAVDDALYFLDGIDQLVLSSLDTNGSPNIQAKFQSFTDVDEYDIALAATVPLTPARRYERPLPPDYLQLGGSRTPPTQTLTTAQTVNWRERSRLDTSIRFEDDATQTPEGGVTYTLEFYLNGVLQGAYTQTGLTGISTTITFGAGLSGSGELRLKAVRSGLDSRTYSSITFTMNT